MYPVTPYGGPSPVSPLAVNLSKNKIEQSLVVSNFAVHLFNTMNFTFMPHDCVYVSDVGQAEFVAEFETGPAQAPATQYDRDALNLSALGHAHTINPPRDRHPVTFEPLDTE